MRPAADEHGERLGLEAGALADRARHLAHVALVALAAPVGVGLGVPALDERDGALEAGGVGALAAVPVAVLDVHLVVLAVQHGLPGPLRAARATGASIENSRSSARAAMTRWKYSAAPEPLAHGAMAPSARLRSSSGTMQLGVDLELGADAGALRAGAERGC